MNFPDYLFLACIVFIGSAVTYGDFKFGKIRNKWILAGLFLGLFFHVFSFLKGWSGFDYLFKVAVNSAAALLIGYLLWYLDFWAAGDAKLFFLLAWLLPLKFYWKSYLPVFPSFVLLINTVIPFLAFIFLQFIYLALKEIRRLYKEGKIRIRFDEIRHKATEQFKINFKSYIPVGLGFILAFLFFQVIRIELKMWLQFEWGQSAIFFLFILLGGGLIKAFTKKEFLILGVVFLIVFLLFAQFFLAQDIFGKLFLSIKSSVLSLYLLALLVFSFSFSVYEKLHKTNLHFAFWLFLGLVFTLIVKGSLLIII